MADKPVIKSVGASLTREEKEGCMVRQCNGCNPHEYQDTKYGLFKRVKNFSKAKGWGCTVCARYESNATK